VLPPLTAMMSAPSILAARSAAVGMAAVLLRSSQPTARPTWRAGRSVGPKYAAFLLKHSAAQL
jgi:hypothetical protein